MTKHLLAILAALALFSGTFQLATPVTSAADVVNGPFNGSFIPDGLGLKKPLNPEGSPVQGGKPWTMYFWVKSDDAAASSSTLLAGFGDPAGAAGTQRFITLRAGKISFWSGGAEVRTQSALRVNQWHFLSATFDGEGVLSVYGDGVKLASQKIKLLDAEAFIHLAPIVKPWTEAAHFAGKIADFTLLPVALTNEEIRSQMARARRLDLTPFEAASKTWQVQLKGQDGLRAPQDAATLPRSPVEPSAPVAKQIENNQPSLTSRGDGEWTLSGGWRLIEAPKIRAGGATVSRPEFKTTNWLDAVVPGTVLTTLVERGIYPDPDFGLNNLAIPESLNKQDYWFRTQFNPPASPAKRRFTITFHGINYLAQVWFNGKPLGDIRGAFTRGVFDVSDLIIPGKPNALAVRVSPPPHPGIPHEQSLAAGPGPNGGAMCLDGPTFICTEGWDWIPGVRDRATGIWQDVTLKATGSVTIGDVHVVTDLPLPDTTRAAVTLTIPLKNDSGRAANGTLEAEFEGVRIRKSIVVVPGQTEVILSPADFPQLNINKPRLWWVNGYGKPELYRLKARFTTTATGESDVKSLRFGIRELSYELTLMDGTGRLQRVEFSPTDVAPIIGEGLVPARIAVNNRAGKHVVNVSHEGMIESVEGWVASFMPGGETSTAIRALQDRRASPHLVLRLNGVRIPCKGGNWGLDDTRKRVSRERMEPYFRLHREANLTMIRNWCGQNTEEVFFDLADEYGLLVWNDFWLSTQEWNLEPSDTALFLQNARDTISRFRHHPSIAIWCGRNEGVPPPAINEGLDELIRTLDGTRYYMPNSRDINLQGSGPWHYSDIVKFFTTRGRGFSTELGLPSPPALDTMRLMLPPTDRWKPNDVWAYHDWHTKSGGDTAQFTKAMDDELGAPTSLEDFDRKAQLLNYASHRAMFEGFNANLWKPNSGRLMWMTHPARLSMAWQMYSIDYGTFGSFYGIKKACEPVHVQLNLPNLETAVVNNTTIELRNLRLSARIFSIDGKEIYTRIEKLDASASATTENFRIEIPKSAGTDVVFIKLELLDPAGRKLSENFYWQATQPSGYRKLNDLVGVELDCLATKKVDSGSVRVEIELSNPTATIAFATQATLRNRLDKSRVLPAYASDNFVSLLPGERRTLTVEVPKSAIRSDMEVALTGWNVKELATRIR